MNTLQRLLYIIYIYIIYYYYIYTYQLYFLWTSVWCSGITARPEILGFNSYFVNPSQALEISGYLYVLFGFGLALFYVRREQEVLLRSLIKTCQDHVINCLHHSASSWSVFSSDPPQLHNLDERFQVTLLFWSFPFLSVGLFIFNLHSEESRDTPKLGLLIARRSCCAEENLISLL